MTPPLLSLQHTHLTFGGDPLLYGATLFVYEGDRVCLVGRNGSGKSTLLKIAAGLKEADTGERFVKPRTTIQYLAQEPDLSRFTRVRDFIMSGLQENDDTYQVPVLLNELGLTGDEDPARLSGGEVRRAALIRLLAQQPDILLLDEPTNHLDLPAITWLEDTLRKLRSAIVVISHDRRFLENLTNRTIWLDRGKTRELAQGFGAFEAWRDTLLEQEALEQHKLKQKIIREEHWLTYGVTARRKRNVRRLKELQQLRSQRKENIVAQENVKFDIARSGSSGKQVIEAVDVCKAYGTRKIVTNFTVKIARGDRIGLIGPNGAGKTTLLQLLTGHLLPDSGHVKLGTKLDITTLDQQRSALKGDVRLMDALTGGRGDVISVGGEQRHVMGYLKDFLFQPEQVRSQVSSLSGGERGRLALAIALAKQSNLLVLDEPTNDLDLETLDLLQEMLGTYQGTVLLVSHDRDFLDRIVTSTLTPTQNGVWLEFPGGYSDMVRQKKSTRTKHSRKQHGAVLQTDKSEKLPRISSSSATKLSFKEKFALETLPEEIEALEVKIRSYKDKMADPNLYTSDTEKFNTLATALEKAQVELTEKEESWLMLETKREENTR